MIILELALAALIGLSLSLLGGGGSILPVPILIYVLGFGAKEAIAMILAVVGAASLFGAAGHWKAGMCRGRDRTRIPPWRARSAVEPYPRPTGPCFAGRRIRKTACAG